MSLGARIKARRAELGLSQTKLATMVDIAGPSLSLLESGKTKSMRQSTLKKMSKALRVPASWFATEGQPEDTSAKAPKTKGKKASAKPLAAGANSLESFIASLSKRDRARLARVLEKIVGIL
jgi:transcriptional regulator with XRE-family HTH domain